MITFSEVIMRGGASILLHPFVVEVLDYFNLIPFQLTPNSFRNIMTFYIIFMEIGIREPSTDVFAYVYCIKVLAEHKGLWYMSKCGPDIEGVWGVGDNLGNYKDRFFFYSLERSRDFRVVSE